MQQVISPIDSSVYAEYALASDEEIRRALDRAGTYTSSIKPFWQAHGAFDEGEKEGSMHTPVVG